MKKLYGLRKRWLTNTVGVICALGLVCVFVVTMVFSAYYYSGITSDLRYRAQTTSAFFDDYLNQNYQEYYQACVDYVKGFEHKNTIELQFINVNGQIVVSSYGTWPGESPTTCKMPSQPAPWILMTTAIPTPESGSLQCLIPCFTAMGK